jgi:hypothetical protein
MAWRHFMTLGFTSSSASSNSPFFCALGAEEDFSAAGRATLWSSNQHLFTNIAKIFVPVPFWGA